MNVCAGVWARVDGLNFKLNHPSWTFDENGVVTGTAVIVMNLSGTVLDHLTGSVFLERREERRTGIP